MQPRLITHKWASPIKTTAVLWSVSHPHHKGVRLHGSAGPTSSMRNGEQTFLHRRKSGCFHCCSTICSNIYDISVSHLFLCIFRSNDIQEHQQIITLTEKSLSTHFFPRGNVLKVIQERKFNIKAVFGNYEYQFFNL